MRSLRWRIGAWYATLQIVAIVVFAVAVTVGFRALLFDQARERLANVADDIARFATQADAILILGDDVSITEALGSTDTLNQWASRHVYVQVDQPDGNTIGKSSNLGAVILPPGADAGAAHPVAYRTVETSLGELLVEDRAIVSHGKVAAVVHVAEDLSLLNRTLARTREIMILTLIAASAAILLASLLLAARALTPIDELTRAVREIGSEDLGRRLRWTNRNDELGRLANTFDAMLARLEEAFARERRFITDASHELKTPLTVVNANANMLQRWGDGDPAIRHEALEAIASESAHLASIVSSMLVLAKAETGEGLERAPVELASAVREAMAAAAPRARAKGLELSLVAHADAVVVGDPGLLRNAVGNLIDNAVKFTERGYVHVAIDAEGGDAVVRVRDSGPGIAAEELPHVFERFYRADKSRSRNIEGTGLGLAIVRSIVQAHGGAVEVESARGTGTTFALRLPLDRSSPSHGAPAPPPVHS